MNSLNTSPPKPFPVDDEGVEAVMVIEVNGIDYPFWRVLHGFQELKAGHEYLLLQVPEEKDPRPLEGRTANIIMYANREMAPMDWILVTTQAKLNGHRVTVIKVNWNTGSELEFEHLMKYTGKHVVTYEGAVSSVLVKQ